ncbi:hypothetical protein Tco_0904515 [Tanacetum coccineum]
MIQTSLWKNTSVSKKKRLKDMVEHLIGRLPHTVRWIYVEVDDSLTNFKSEYPAIVFDDTTLSCEPTVSLLNENKIDFRISFDEFDDEDYMVIFDENSFSYKIIYVNNLKTDSENENDKINTPSSPEPTISHSDDLDFFKDFENEFLAINYNDNLTFKLDHLTEPSISSRHIDEFDLKNETSLSEFNEDEQKILYFDEIFSFNATFPNNLESDKDDDDDKIDITQLSRRNIINIDAKRSNKLLEANMAPLPSRDQRYPWLMYQVEGYAKDIMHSYEQRLETIWGRSVNQVHILDFVGLTEEIRHNLGDRLRIVYTRDEGYELFTSHAWRRLFEIRAPLVQEFILEFFSTCRMSDTEMGLDVAGTLCF